MRKRYLHHWPYVKVHFHWVKVKSLANEFSGNSACYSHRAWQRSFVFTRCKWALKLSFERLFDGILLLPVCFLLCVMRCPLWEKLSPQILHSKFFSPVKMAKTKITIKITLNYLQKRFLLKRAFVLLFIYIEYCNVSSVCTFGLFALNETEGESDIAFEWVARILEVFSTSAP